ncbi:MAG: IS1634 family transposase [Kofleriaceae bacterium]|nr:MAG: IS1634 family transposase [Kofleriaceae bacterium]
MYLRITKRKNADGTEVRYYQLAENVWNAERGHAIAKVVYNFGRADEIDHDDLRRLASSILRVVGDGSVAGDGVTIRDAWPYGVVWVVEQIWKQLGVEQILRKYAGKHKPATVTEFVRAIFAMVANRTHAPVSKLHCWEQWMRDDVFLPAAAEVDLHHLYLGMDFLENHKADVEQAIYFSMADLMNADVDLVFYDTTSLHFEIDDEDEAQQSKGDRTYRPQRKRGYSKNGRDDAPQVVIGLAVTRDGLPVRSWIFPGNTADVATVEKVKEDLRGWRLGRCVFVGDAGMTSEDNRRTLALGGGKYILGAKMRAGDEVTTEVLARQGRYHEVRDNLRVKEVVVGDGERRRRYVVCHNPDEAARQGEHRRKLVAQLEAEIAAMKASTSKHSKRVCTLLASSRYARYLRETSGGKLRIDRAAVAEAARYDGKWVITSNDDTLTAEDLALGYKQLEQEHNNRGLSRAA